MLAMRCASPLTPRRRFDCRGRLPPLQGDNVRLGPRSTTQSPNALRNSGAEIALAPVSPRGLRCVHGTNAFRKMPPPVPVPRLPRRKSGDQIRSFSVRQRSLELSQDQVPSGRCPSFRGSEEGCRVPAASFTSKAAPVSIAGTSPPTSKLTTNSSVCSAPMLLRPGVSDTALLQSVLCIQRAWAANRDRLRLLRAKRQLEGKQCFATTKTIQQAPARSAPVVTRPAESTLATLGSEDPDAAWDQALAHRQPSATQAMESQRRWLQDLGLEGEQLLCTLDAPEAQSMLRRMSQLESRLQLRIQKAASSAWRPPCGVGAAACAEIETELSSWLGTPPSGPTTPLTAVLLPSLWLFQLIIAGSMLYRRCDEKAQHWLTLLERSLGDAQIFCAAARPWIEARHCLLVARMKLLTGGDYAETLHAAKRGLELLTETRSLRSFWPAHCWEIAACHRLIAIGQAGLGRFGEALASITEASQHLASPGGRAAEPRLVSLLQDDLRVLRLEFDVSLRVDGADAAYARVLQDEVGAPAAVQAALDAANSLLQEFGERDLLPELSNGNGLARVQALMAKLALLQEMPFVLADSGRPEALATVTQYLAEARRRLSPAACAQKIAPVEAAQMALTRDGALGVERVQGWSQECSKLFGQDSGHTQHVRQAVAALVPELERLPRRSRQIQRALRDVLACTGAGLRDFAQH